jgi:hypothetical protein
MWSPTNYKRGVTNRGAGSDDLEIFELEIFAAEGARHITLTKIQNSK